MAKFIKIVLLIIIGFGGLDCTPNGQFTFTNNNLTSDTLTEKEKILLPEALDFCAYVRTIAREPALDTLPQESYRVMLKNVLGKSYCLRFEKRNNQPYLIYKEFSKVSGESEYSLKISREDPITNKEWNFLLKLLRDYHFWTVSPRLVQHEALDGYAMILEGRLPNAGNRDKNYQLVVLANPGETDIIQEIGWQLLDCFVEN